MDSGKVELTKAVIAGVDVLDARMAQLHREAIEALRTKIDNELRAIREELHAELTAFTDAVDEVRKRLEVI